MRSASKEEFIDNLKDIVSDQKDSATFFVCYEDVVELLKRYDELESQLKHKYKLLDDAWEEARLCHKCIKKLEAEIERLNRECISTFLHETRMIEAGQREQMLVTALENVKTHQETLTDRPGLTMSWQIAFQALEEYKGIQK